MQTAQPAGGSIASTRSRFNSAHPVLGPCRNRGDRPSTSEASLCDFDLITHAIGLVTETGHLVQLAQTGEPVALFPVADDVMSMAFNRGQSVQLFGGANLMTLRIPATDQGRAAHIDRNS